LAGVFTKSEADPDIFQLTHIFKLSKTKKSTLWCPEPQQLSNLKANIRKKASSYARIIANL
jgi:hypothetical protein